MKPLIFLVLCSITQLTLAQNIFKARVLDTRSKEPLIGVNAAVSGMSLGSSSDVNGLIEINGVPDGEQEIKFSFIGYRTQVMTFVFPLGNQETIEVMLELDATN